MAQVNSIRELFFEKGLTYAEIARTTGHDVKTVKKYIMMGNFNEPLPKPRQVRGSKLDVYKSQIDEWLEPVSYTHLDVYKRQLCTSS